MFAQRRSNGNSQPLLGLADDEPDFVVVEINLAPAKECDIGQPLAGVETELYQARPLRVSNREKATQLIDGEWSAVVVAGGYSERSRSLESSRGRLRRSGHLSKSCIWAIHPKAF